MEQLFQLPDISEVESLTAEDSDCVSELIQVLRKHGRLNRFGLTLLHQHFDVAEDEMLLEESDPVTRTLLIQPVKKSELSGVQYKATSWRLDSGKPLMGCACRAVDGNHNHFSYQGIKTKPTIG